MDLTKIAPDTKRGATLELNGPDGAPILKKDGKPVTITVLGRDSDIAIAHANQVGNRRLAQAGRVRPTSESIRADENALFAKLTVGWDGIGLGEEETPFNYEAALRLYSTPELAFIRDQVEAFIEDRANFTKGSPKA